MKKPQLLELTKSVRTEKLYLVDNIIKENRHDALHLPPYHPDLNRIRLVWGDINIRVAQECLSMNLKEKQVFCEKVFAEYMKEKWQNCCSHVNKIEEEYWQQDGLMDEHDYSVRRQLRFWSSSEDE
jgi:hypothetical protein